MSFSNHVQAGSGVSFADTIVGVESAQDSKRTPEEGGPSSPSGVIPPIIPPLDTPGRARTLVLCFDGTGDQYASFLTHELIISLTSHPQIRCRCVSNDLLHRRQH